MTPSLSPADLHASGLVRLLTSLLEPPVNHGTVAIAERLGRLLDMNGSLKLSQVHARLARLSFEADPTLARSLEASCQDVRKALEQRIHDSFTIRERTGFHIKLPELAADTPLDRCPPFEPYLRFYQAHQREFGFRLQALQADARQAASGVSLRLTRLAVLDRVLGDFMQPLTQRSLAQIPRLLGQRFSQRFQSYRQQLDASFTPTLDDWQVPEGWLTQFHTELKSTLLLEIDLRMQPILGLIEAINEHTQPL